MAKIVVTGGSGWLGRGVVRRLLDRGDTVVSVDMGIHPELEEASRRGKAVRNFIADLGESQTIREILAEAVPDAVVHCAAVVGVLQCDDIPVKALRVNVEGMVNLLEAMRATGVRRMIHVSTEETYGDFQSARVDENHPQNPTSIYGLTKLAAEHYANVYSRNHGLECIHVRTCWVYGPDLPRPRMPKTYIDAALRGEPLVEPSGGDFAVDQVFIEDTVTGIVLALDKKDHRFDAYNIATGSAPTLSDVANIVNAAIPGGTVRIEPGPLRLDGRILSARKGALDISRAESELGYKSSYPIERGIQIMIEESRRTMQGK